MKNNFKEICESCIFKKSCLDFGSPTYENKGNIGEGGTSTPKRCDNHPEQFFGIYIPDS